MGCKYTNEIIICNQKHEKCHIYLLLIAFPGFPEIYLIPNLEFGRFVHAIELVKPGEFHAIQLRNVSHSFTLFYNMHIMSARRSVSFRLNIEYIAGLQLRVGRKVVIFRKFPAHKFQFIG